MIPHDGSSTSLFIPIYLLYLYEHVDPIFDGSFEIYYDMSVYFDELQILGIWECYIFRMVYVYVCIRIDIDVYVCSVCTSTLMFWPISQSEFLSTLDWMSVVQSVYADCRKSHTQNKLSNHMELPRDILN